MGITMMPATNGDHQLSRMSGATIPMVPRTIRTVAGTNMNAPGDMTSARSIRKPIIRNARPSSKPPVAMADTTAGSVYMVYDGCPVRDCSGNQTEMKNSARGTERVGGYLILSLAMG